MSTIRIMNEGSSRNIKRQCLKRGAVQRGFAAIAAVFLVVGLAALGAFMLSLSNTQQVTSAQDTLGTRAYWAARSGLEWAVMAAPTVCLTPALTDLAPGIAPAVIEGFAITITCARNVYTEAGVPRNIYRVTATASMGAGAGEVGFIERSVSSGFER
jgi:MSHA biogenesis protein MshP